MNETPPIERFTQYVPNPLTADLPAYLKDPANYDKVRKALLDELATTHSHSDMLDWFKCTSCQIKAKNHVDMMRKFGFKNAAQYMAWQKIHTQIKGRQILPKYNT